MSERVTIYDISKRANVSAMTVSRALRPGSRKAVHPDTAKRIVAIAEELNYQPYTAARELTLRKTLNIGFCINSPQFNYYRPLIRPLLQTLQTELDTHGYRLGYYYFQGGADPQFAEFLKTGRVVDAIVVFGRNLCKEEISIIRKSKIRAVSLFEAIKGLHSIVVDDFSGGRMAADYLWGRGFREVAQIALWLGEESQKRWNGRIIGFQERAAELGMKVVSIENHWDKAYDLPYAWYHGKTAPDLIERIQALGEAGRCVYVNSDSYAFGLLRQMDEKGLAVGKDISILSFDNAEALGYGPWEVPRLTTFERPRVEIGRFAARLAMALTDDAETPKEHTFPVTLIERSSVGWGPEGVRPMPVPYYP